MNIKNEMKYFHSKQAQQRSTFPNLYKKDIQHALRAPSCHCQPVSKSEFSKYIYFLHIHPLLYSRINPEKDDIKYSKELSPNLSSNNQRI